MPDLNGFDYAFADPDPGQMRAAGVEIVGRYLWNGGKGITLAERQKLHAGGLGVFHYYEAGRGYLLTDTGTVRGHGVHAVNIALGLGVPAGCPIVHSIDVDITSSTQLSVLGRSFEQLQQARGRYTIAGYGEADAVDWLRGRGLISEFVVQTVAWSGGRVSEHAAVLQYAIEQNFHGQSVDYLTILNRPAVERAVWWPSGHNPPAPTPSPVKEADMELWLLKGTSSGFWLAGGTAVTSNVNSTRTEFIAQGGKVYTVSDDDEFNRIRKAYSS